MGRIQIEYFITLLNEPWLMIVLSPLEDRITSHLSPPLEKLKTRADKTINWLAMIKEI